MPQYLDDQGNPIKSTYLDDTGSPISEQPNNTNPLSMTYAIVNGVKVPLGGDEADIVSRVEQPKPELSKGESAQPAISAFERLLKPIVDVSPETRQHMMEFEQVHPILGKIGRTGLDMILGESSPLSLGLGAAGAGESVANGLGMEGLANTLKIPSRAAGAGMVWHGLGKVGDGDGLGEKLGGGLEAALGGLAMRGPRGASQLEREPSQVPVTRITDPDLPLTSDKEDTWFALGHLDDEKAAQLNDMYKSGKGRINRTYIDRSLLDRSQNMSDEFGNEIIKVPTSRLTQQNASPELESPRRQIIPPEINPAVNLTRETPRRMPYPEAYKERDRLEGMPESMPDHPGHKEWSRIYDEVDTIISDADSIRVKPVGNYSKLFRDSNKTNKKIPDWNHTYLNGSVWVDNLYGSGAGGAARDEDIAFMRDTARMKGEDESPFIRPVNKLERETPITAQDMSFFKKFITDESGSVKLPDIGETRKRPLRALDELHDALIDASSVRENTETLYKGERSKRFSDVESVTTQGRKGFYERLSKLKGSLPKAQFQPVDINPDSARALYNEINRSSLSTPEKIRASTGLGKVLGDYGNGEVPQRNEIDMLRKVFGDPVADQLMNMHAGIPITKAALNEVANFSKSMMSSMDASAPFRQGLGLVHTREFWQNYSKMYSYIGRRAYDAAMESIHSDKLFEPLRKAGLQITEIGTELGAREEQFASRLAEKIPGIPASERMYTGFLNKTRFDVSKRLMQEAENAGLQPFTKNSAGELVPTKLGKEITAYVNNATGRGSLGRFEKNAVELNSLFFSPRLISSRLTLLNPAYYVNANPFVRKQALKSLFAMATAGKIIEELGKAAGGTVETADKTSSDYHKVRIGNTRIDPYGGFQQYIVAANRLLAGAANSALGNEDGMNLKTAAARTFGVSGKYPSMGENKLSPVAKFADDILFARQADDSGAGSAMTVAGIPHSAAGAKVANLFTPMILQDLADLMKEDPKLVPLSFLSSQGMGVQTYQPSASQSGQDSTGFKQLVR